MKLIKFIAFLSLFSVATMSLPVVPQNTPVKRSLTQTIYNHRYFKRAAIVSAAIILTVITLYNRDKLINRSGSNLDRLSDGIAQAASTDVAPAQPDAEQEFKEEMPESLQSSQNSNDYEDLLSQPLDGWRADINSRLTQLSEKNQ